jgi:protein TonB
MPVVGQGVGSDKNGRYTQDFFADHDGEAALSRSLIFAFVCALLLHSVVALVDLNAFKRPSSVKISSKTLTMNIVAPQPIKKLPIGKNPSIAAKKPILKKRITNKIKQKQKVKPKVAMIKKIQPDRSAMKKELPKKNEILADFSYVPFPHDKKKEDDFIEEYVFIPDMVDIPQPLPDTDNTPHKVKKDEVPDLVSYVPITYAHPIYKRNISPPYPLLARKRGYQGTVLLEVLVSKDGKAASIQLSRSSGYNILDRAAIKGVREWLFYPAKRGDELLEMWVKIPIRFTLN